MRPVLSVIFGLVGLVGPLLLCRGVWAQSGGGGKFATSLCAEPIRPNGYTCIENQVVTDDGFILGLQNIPSPRGQTQPSGGPPVLLMHAIIAGGDNFVVNSPEQSLGFVLADAGYDVWIANNRAIQWSHGHQTLSPSSDAYWDWTYDELASYDLKALIEYVYNQRNGRKLAYIGHSQGTVLLFAALTGGQFKTQILGYLNAAVLAPVAFVSHITAPIVKTGLGIYLDEILTLIGNGEFDPNIFFNISCTSPLIEPLACKNIAIGLLGKGSYQNQSCLGFYAQYSPQPTSSFNVNHFGQGFRKGTFQFYAKSPLDNPPNYDLTTFPTSLPLQLWTGGVNDGLADPIDVDALLAQLPSSNREVNTLADYGHIDFTYGYRAYLDVYPGVITFLQNHAL